MNPADYDPRGPQTPFGEPIVDEDSASQKAEDPVKWHLKYWLNLFVVGINRGEDDGLMNARIDWEHVNIANEAFKKDLRFSWFDFQTENEDRYILEWEHIIGGEKLHAYIRDLNRMLVNKGQKMRDYLLRKHRLIAKYQADGNIVAVHSLNFEIDQLNRLLRQEERGSSPDQD